MDHWLIFFWASVTVLAAIEHMLPLSARPSRRGLRWPTNFSLGVINGLLVAMVPVSSVAAALFAQSSGTGLLNWIGPPWWVAVVATLALRSLAQYLFHVGMHKVPALWAIHRVHHCDRHIDVSSAVRFHPAEMLASILWFALVALALGLDPAAVAAMEIAEVLFGLATHANLRLPRAIERVLVTVFITPRLHHAHHSMDPVVADMNYGTVLSVWDRLLGTLHEPDLTTDGLPLLSPGLAEISEEHAARLGTQLLLPVAPKAK